jgi:hypothetical protein
VTGDFVGFEALLRAMGFAKSSTHPTRYPSFRDAPQAQIRNPEMISARFPDVQLHI